MDAEDSFEPSSPECVPWHGLCLPGRRSKVPCGVGGLGGLVNHKLGFWFGQLVAPYAVTGNGSGSGEENNQCSFHLNSNKKHEVIFFKNMKLSH